MKGTRPLEAPTTTSTHRSSGRRATTRIADMTTAAGKFTVVGGNEQVYREAPGEVRLTRVSGTQKFVGAIVGDGSVEWVFCYRADRTARFLGLQRIEGAIDGGAGSRVV